tara:strand:- start:1543 stop:1782 length:240 start_codon:yes stop_codon:yes gene_type:complete
MSVANKYFFFKEKGSRSEQKKDFSGVKNIDLTLKVLDILLYRQNPFVPTKVGTKGFPLSKKQRNKTKNKIISLFKQILR